MAIHLLVCMLMVFAASGCGLSRNSGYELSPSGRVTLSTVPTDEQIARLALPRNDGEVRIIPIAGQLLEGGVALQLLVMAPLDIKTHRDADVAYRFGNSGLNLWYNLPVTAFEFTGQDGRQLGIGPSIDRVPAGVIRCWAAPDFSDVVPWKGSAYYLIECRFCVRRLNEPEWCTFRFNPNDPFFERLAAGDANSQGEHAARRMRVVIDDVPRRVYIHLLAAK